MPGVLVSGLILEAWRAPNPLGKGAIGVFGQSVL